MKEIRVISPAPVNPEDEKSGLWRSFWGWFFPEWKKRKRQGERMLEATIQEKEMNVRDKYYDSELKRLQALKIENELDDNQRLDVIDITNRAAVLEEKKLESNKNLQNPSDEDLLKQLDQIASKIEHYEELFGHKIDFDLKILYFSAFTNFRDEVFTQ